MARVRASFRTEPARALSHVRGETGCAGSFERAKTDSDVLSPSRRFFKRLRWAFHGRATPDFEPGRGLSAHYQPGTLNALVNHPSALAFCCRDFSPRRCARDLPRRDRAEEHDFGGTRARGGRAARTRYLVTVARNVRTQRTHTLVRRLAFYGSIRCVAGAKSPG